MTLCAYSTHLDRFENTLGKAGRSDLVHNMDILRHHSFNAFDLATLVSRLEDPLLFRTGEEYLTFLSYGSPKLRFVFSQILTYLLPRKLGEKPKKLLLTEDIPLAAYYFELVLNLSYVETAVLHSGLSDEERVKLIARFNDPDNPLCIVIIMYSVNAAGANLDTAFCRALVLTPAINSAIEAQAYSRVLRVRFSIYISFILGQG
jgi:hypothetical protein